MQSERRLSLTTLFFPEAFAADITVTTFALLSCAQVTADVAALASIIAAIAPARIVFFMITPPFTCLLNIPRYPLRRYPGFRDVYHFQS